MTSFVEGSEERHRPAIVPPLNLRSLLGGGIHQSYGGTTGGGRHAGREGEEEEEEEEEEEQDEDGNSPQLRFGEEDPLAILQRASMTSSTGRTSVLRNPSGISPRVSSHSVQVRSVSVTVQS